MRFDFFITVRSQPGKDSDCSRALERVAFFPGVTAAGMVERNHDSIKIGYDGEPQARSARTFDQELQAEGLVADRLLWDDESDVDGCSYFRKRA